MIINNNKVAFILFGFLVLVGCRAYNFKLNINLYSEERVSKDIKLILNKNILFEDTLISTFSEVENIYSFKSEYNVDGQNYLQIILDDVIIVDTVISGEINHELTFIIRNDSLSYSLIEGQYK